ncbi:MAG: TerB family tellurite resistance protein [Maricaulaceae bacterium]
MHFVIGTLIAIATLVFWLGRASQGAREIASTANELANLPRKRRFAKNYNKRGHDLIETPLEAATVMLLATARMSDERCVTENAELAIVSALRADMHLSTEDADGIMRQIAGITHDIVLPESALFPMVKIFRDHIEREDATRLAAMMESVAAVDGGANTEQKEFIRRFREHMGLVS